MRSILIALALVVVAASATDLQQQNQMEIINRLRSSVHLALSDAAERQAAFSTHARVMLDSLNSVPDTKKHLLARDDSACLTAVNTLKNNAKWGVCNTTGAAALDFSSDVTTRQTARTAFCTTNDCINALAADFGNVRSACTDVAARFPSFSIEVSRVAAALRTICAVRDAVPCIDRFWTAVDTLRTKTVDTMTSSDLDQVCTPCVFQSVRAIGKWGVENGFLTLDAVNVVKGSLRAICRRFEQKYCVLTLRELSTSLQDAVTGITASNVQDKLTKILDGLCNPCITRVLRAFQIYADGISPLALATNAFSSFMRPICRKDGGTYCLLKILQAGLDVQTALAQFLSLGTDNPPCSAGCDATCQSIVNAVKSVGCCWSTLWEFVSPLADSSALVNSISNVLSKCSSAPPAPCQDCERKWAIEGRVTNVLCDPNNFNDTVWRATWCRQANSCFGSVLGCATFSAQCSGGNVSITSTGGYCQNTPTSSDDILQCLDVTSEIEQVADEKDPTAPVGTLVTRAASASTIAASIGALLVVVLAALF